MTYFPYIGFNPKEAYTDAFGRLRVSNPLTIFTSKYIFDSQDLLWDDVQTSGGGTSSTHAANTASVTLAVTNVTAGIRVRQTKRWFPYQPGKSQLIMMTFVMGTAAAGIIKRIGLYNAQNGIFFETNGTTVNLVRRTYVTGSAVDNTVAQASWNLDPMNGSGDSGITLDITKAQILVIDLEWLGVGRVRIGWNIDGVTYYCHEMLNANVLADVYMSSANLPLRLEIQNSGAGAAHSIKQICCTIISEGGNEKLGQARNVTRGAASLTTGNNTSIYPLISIRLKTTHLGAFVLPEGFSVLCTSTADFEALLILNPTIGGVDAASWTDQSNGSIQYDVTRDNTNVLTGGTILYSELATSTTQTKASIGQDVKEPQTLLLGSKVDGTRDEVIVAVRNLSAGVEVYYAALNYREIV